MKALKAFIFCDHTLVDVSAQLLSTVPVFQRSPRPQGIPSVVRKPVSMQALERGTQQDVE